MTKHYDKHASTKKKGSFLGRLFKFIGVLLLIVVILAGGLIAFLSATEFKPEDKVAVNTTGSAMAELKTGDEIKVVTWNIGYGALGDNADFFMDGGKMVNTADEARVNSNLDGIQAGLSEEAPNIFLLQEVDRSSTRSHKINELERMKEAFPDYSSAFANNFKVAFLPYPIPPIGKVDSGIATFSSYPVSSSLRQQLPNPFSWPIRMANLKRCLLISRIPMADSDKELVIVNLHLEAYDSGEGKVAQTKKLAEILAAEAEKGNYVIAGGDFNQIFSSEDINIYPPQEGKWTPGIIDLEEIEGDWHFLMDETSPTCRSLDQAYAGADAETFQYYLIDGFIVSGNVKVKSHTTKNLNFVSSDHNPVVIEVAIGEKPKPPKKEKINEDGTPVVEDGEETEAEG